MSGLMYDVFMYVSKFEMFLFSLRVIASSWLKVQKNDTPCCSIQVFKCLICLFKDPPVVQVDMEDLCVRPGQPAMFSVVITGQPIPEISWSKVWSYYISHGL